ELARLCREDVNLFVRTGLSTLCVATRPSPHAVRMFAEIGRSNLLHAGGSSTVLLAFAPAEVQEALLHGELKMYTPLTLTDPVRLRQRLEQVRRDGYHIARGDVDEAGFSIAAPVHGHAGEVVAALSIAGALSRLNKQASEHHLALVKDFAGRMSRQLGGSPLAGRARK
ncbi:MAG TPA: IclR family transcriptional regulator C-terminal domain-containing protein, partial [Candidatus Polarisedimenticolia bacterium]|nr:IclR family transcriptional regulator C-terminal domain-containing protein [Candidatus Polarisedimenticolia bacterium]